jgi:hypothetical protein
MSYTDARDVLLREAGVEQSTMMGTPCLRYSGQFMAMLFDRQDALIIKVAPARVDELIASGKGLEFNFTKKRFREWVLIPIEFEDCYEAYLREALAYAKSK